MAIKISGSTIIDDSRNIGNAGVVTATSFVGDVTGTASTATAAGTAYGLTGSPDVTVGVLTATTISAGSTTGTEGQVLQSTGVGVTWADSATGGISISDSNVIGYNSAGIRSDTANGRLEVFGTGNFQVFTSPGTYIVNPGISSIRVRVVGAGGNGATAVGPTGAAGGGGGGGGYAHKVITSFSTPRTYTVTIGSAPGGTSSFGSEVSATGGSNAPGASGGAGGSGSSGDFNATGATGVSGTPSASPSPSISFVGGRGGASGTQKGNGSGANVPGIPNSVFNSRRYISRFPFDIFEGHEGTNNYGTPVVNANGVEGGAGASAPNGAAPNIGFAGIGGVGAGGGGGSNLGSPFAPGASGGLGGGGGGGGGGNFSPGPGGAGGNGIVIVEW